MNDIISTTQVSSGGHSGYDRFDPNAKPPPGYICHRCGKPGHFKRYCPASQPKYNSRKEMQQAQAEGKDVPKTRPVNENEFDRLLLRGSYQIPARTTRAEIAARNSKYICPICGKLVRDAVNACCDTNYCNECIRQALIVGEFKCPTCGSDADDVEEDEIVPNGEIRKAVYDFLHPEKRLQTSSEVKKLPSSETKSQPIHSGPAKVIGPNTTQSSVVTKPANSTEVQNYATSVSGKGPLVPPTGSAGSVFKQKAESEPPQQPASSDSQSMGAPVVHARSGNQNDADGMSSSAADGTLQSDATKQQMPAASQEVEHVKSANTNNSSENKEGVHDKANRDHNAYSDAQNKQGRMNTTDSGNQQIINGYRGENTDFNKRRYHRPNEVSHHEYDRRYGPPPQWRPNYDYHDGPPPPPHPRDHYRGGPPSRHRDDYGGPPPQRPHDHYRDGPPPPRHRDDYRNGPPPPRSYGPPYGPLDRWNGPSEWSDRRYREEYHWNRRNDYGPDRDRMGHPVGPSRGPPRPPRGPRRGPPRGYFRRDRSPQHRGGEYDRPPPGRYDNDYPSHDRLQSFHRDREPRNQNVVEEEQRPRNGGNGERRYLDHRSDDIPSDEEPQKRTRMGKREYGATGFGSEKLKEPSQDSRAFSDETAKGSFDPEASATGRERSPSHDQNDALKRRNEPGVDDRRRDSKGTQRQEDLEQKDETDFADSSSRSRGEINGRRNSSRDKENKRTRKRKSPGRRDARTTVPKDSSLREKKNRHEGESDAREGRRKWKRTIILETSDDLEPKSIAEDRWRPPTKQHFVVKRKDKSRERDVAHKKNRQAASKMNGGAEVVSTKRSETGATGKRTRKVILRKKKKTKRKHRQETEQVSNAKSKNKSVKRRVFVKR